MRFASGLVRIIVALGERIGPGRRILATILLKQPLEIGAIAPSSTSTGNMAGIGKLDKVAGAALAEYFFVYRSTAKTHRIITAGTNIHRDVPIALYFHCQSRH